MPISQNAYGSITSPAQTTLNATSTSSALNITGSGGTTITLTAPNTININSTGGAGGTPGGANTNVQYNDGGAFGGDAGFTYNKTTHVMSLTGINLSGLTASQAVVTDGSKNLSSLSYTDTSTASTLVSRDANGISSFKQLNLDGVTSGSCALKVPAVAGSGTIFQVPGDNGTANYVLSTNGSGILSWAAPGTGAAVNAQTGTTYTIAASDNGKLITFNNASSVTVTLPQQSTVTTAAGFYFWYLNIGVGLVTFVKEGSETITGNTTCATNASGQFSRNTITNWSNFGGTSTITMVGSSLNLATFTTNEIRNLMWVGAPITILGLYQKVNGTIGVAGAFSIRKNGSSLSGLALVPSVPGVYRAAAGTGGDNICVRGDIITIVADATLTNITNLALTIDYTQNF